MYEYKFVRIETVFLTKHPQNEYQDIIISHAKKGWRFKQVFAPVTSSSGLAKIFDLIFEKEINCITICSLVCI